MGLYDSGKTTVMYKIKLGEVVTTLPTIGHKVESQQYKNLNLVSFDVGGRDRVRPLWRHYWDGASAVIWIVNSDNGGEAAWSWEHDAAREFQNMLAEEQLKGLPLLILANKQDLPTALSLDEIKLRLKVDEIKDRPWYIQGSCGETGDGLYEGFDWLVTRIRTFSRLSSLPQVSTSQE